MSTSHLRKKNRSHRIKVNERCELPRRIVFFDVETRPLEQSEGEERHSFRLAVAWYYNLEKKLKDTPTARQVFFSPHALWAWVFSLIRARSKLYVIAHNIDFDMGASEGFKHLKENGYRITKFFVDSGRFIIEARSGSKTVVFLDSMNFFKMALSELGKHIGLEKLQMPDWNDADEKWITYCERDVEILAKTFIWYLKFLKEYDLGNFGYTISAQAYNCYRHRFMTAEIFTHHFFNVELCEIESYFGGRTEAFRVGRIKERVYYLDVNSMYPFVMKTYEYPVRYVATLHDVPVEELQKIMKKYCVIANIEVETNEPILPYRAHKTIFPTGRFSGWYCTPEVELALEKGSVKRVNCVHIYKKARIFEKYVDFFFNLKKQAKQEGNKFVYLLTKLYLNSLYGKFGQRTEELVEVSENEISDEELSEVLVSTGTGRITYYKINGQVFRKERREVSYNSFVAIASHVTSYARVHLYRLIETAGFENVYYCDTDSLFVNEVGYRKLKEWIDEEKLGYLKLEQVGDDVEIIAPKVYRFNGVEKIKGVPKSAEKVGQNVYKFMSFEKTKTRLRKGRENEIYAVERIKKLSLTYDKGKVLDDGRVIPLVVEEARQFSDLARFL